MAKKVIYLALVTIASSFELFAQERLTVYTYPIPPLVEVSRDADVKGNAWNVIQHILERNEVNYDVLIKPAIRGLVTVSENKNTCVFPVDRTQDRESSYSWVGPIAINQYALYSAPGTHIPLITLNDAKSYNIATYLGSSIGDYLKKGGFHVRLTGELKQGLLMLKYGRVDFWVADTNAAQQLSEKLDIPLGEPELIFFTSINYMACHPDISNSLLREMKQVLDEMYISGDIQHYLKLDL